MSTASDSVAATPGGGAVRAWLYLVALMIVAMVVVGGATRLTESGLSITEWQPIHGVIPPLSIAARLARTRCQIAADALTDAESAGR